MLTIDKRAEPHIRALARAIGWERREVIQALQAHASIEQVAREPVKSRPSAVMEPVQSRAQPVPKFEYARSRVLLDAYSFIPCQFDNDVGTGICGRLLTVGCHSNWAVHGKGKSIKASDIYCASGCAEHHRELDQGKAWSEAERREKWWGAHVRTVNELLRRGHWPKGIPSPDLAWPKEWD